MRNIRIYQPPPLDKLNNVTLTKAAAHHVANVLRLKVGGAITLFDGENNEYACLIHELTKRSVSVKIIRHEIIKRESPVYIHLYQGLTRSDKMDVIIQKATELGASEITPVFFERSQHKKSAGRIQKKQEHWEKVAISACEQSGRNQLPHLHSPIDLEHLLSSASDSLKLVLSPTSTNRLIEISTENPKRVVLVIGPEGGLSPAELDRFMAHDFFMLSLGPRVLRAETAAIAGLTLIQSLYGDF